MVVSGLTAQTSVTSRRPVLQDVSISFEPGEITLVIGPVGAGKSTLVACLAGLCRPSAGTIALSGASLWRGRRINPDVLRRIGVVWQAPEDQLFASTGLGEFRYTLKPLRLDRGALHERITKALHSVDLPEQVLIDNPFQLSGGGQRRLVLATTIAAEPEWLIADEPTAGLDGAACKDVIAWFRDVADTTTRGVIVVTHDLDDWLPVADKLVFIHNGTITRVATPTQLLADGVWPSDAVAEPTAFQLLRTIGVTAPLPQANSVCATSQWTPSVVAEALMAAERHTPKLVSRESRPVVALAGLDVPEPEPSSRRGTRIRELVPSAKWVCYMLLSCGVLLQQGVLGALLGLCVAVAVCALTAVPPGQVWRSARPVVILYAVSALFAGVHLSRIHHSSTPFGGLPVAFSMVSAETVLVHFTTMVLIVTLASVFSFSTTTLEMKQGLRHALSGLRRMRVPIEVLSLAAALVLRLIPLLQAEATRFANIARSRGKSASRNGLRLRDIPAIVIPLTLSVLRYGDAISTALDARGYQLTATHGDDGTQTRWARRDIVAVAICCLVLAGLTATRVLAH